MNFKQKTNNEQPQRRHGAVSINSAVHSAFPEMLCCNEFNLTN